ncbi:unnamed protein product [Lepeophtheirus salmonis]|uniref:(salmon louse) hypothetical protein n=1 Tax=Lepeophtheirus salmonis TaxID=72036 RepID=A0A7R8CI43_LEPSM|nr:unnamed protein product [Lepeophtheirus salmonis]CAF2829264.1 unnamed protein product [Lepeophtheirus salmonis]
MHVQNYCEKVDPVTKPNRDPVILKLIEQNEELKRLSSTGRPAKLTPEMAKKAFEDKPTLFMAKFAKKKSVAPMTQQQQDACLERAKHILTTLNIMATVCPILLEDVGRLDR